MKFYEANIESVDLENKQILITHAVGKETDPIAWRSHVSKYDYPVLALGGETNFFGMTEVAKHAFTMKSIDDAMILRNHVINTLQQADVESENKELKRSLITFVVNPQYYNNIKSRIVWIKSCETKSRRGEAR